MMYAYAHRREGPWQGEFDSRAKAEEAGREDQPSDRFVMVWTARIIKLTIGDLVRGGPLLHLLRDQSDYHLITTDIEEKKLNALEDEVGRVIDKWAGEHSIQRHFERYIEIEPGFYCIDFKTALKAKAGNDMKYAADAPVISEMHYMTLLGRMERFARRQKRVDLQGRRLDDRMEAMSRAMLEWDAKFPLPGMHRYEQRVREIKAVLRSPWLPVGVIHKDSDGNRTYHYQQDGDGLTDEECRNREYYRLLQRELRWLKRRLTEIYAARHWRRSPNGKRYLSETPSSTAARSG